MQFHPFIYFAFIFLLCYRSIAQDAEQGTNKLTKDATEEILNKITKISIQSLSSATKEGKVEILKEVEKKLLKAAKSLGKKGERYVELIMKGIKQKALEEKNNSAINVRIDISANNDSNIKRDKKKLKQIHNDGFEIQSNVSKNKIEIKTPIISSKDTESIIENKHSVDNYIEENRTSNRDDVGVIKNNLKQINAIFRGSNEIYNPANDAPLQTSTERLIQSFTPRHECESILDRTCMNIKQMRLLKCHFGDTDVPIEKLCDGFVDCPGRTDETFCTSQVTERVRNANSVISDAEESYTLGCFPNNTKKSIITTEIITFRSILQSQQEFVEKYKYLNWSLLRNSDTKGEGTVKKTVHEVSLIIKSLAFALDAVLCSHRGEMVNRRNFNDLFVKDLDEAIREIDEPPKSCVCKRGRCTKGACTDVCKQVCLQTYKLARWPCESINETDSVPMSVICDGKFDCYDQTDEKGCVTGITFAKFEAHVIFNKILASLSGKITSKEYSSVRKMLLALHQSIENLQKVCMDPEPNLKTIRRLRNDCFSSLKSIYSEVVSTSSFLYETEEAYLFLLSTNEMIVNALKRSNTGNARIIENDGCYCSNKRCSMPVCTRKCIRICIAEPKLTRYYCDGSFNKSVAIDEICDGKPKCPREDDETKCKKDVCRQHHLSLLRHNLQRVGKNKEGTAMGELLETWKLKASSTLQVAENNGRPTPMIIKDIVKNILNDLVNTYGAVEDYRRDNEYALKEFADIANYVMKSIRSCGN